MGKSFPRRWTMSHLGPEGEMSLWKALKEKQGHGCSGTALRLEGGSLAIQLLLRVWTFIIKKWRVLDRF